MYFCLSNFSASTYYFILLPMQKIIYNVYFISASFNE